MESLQYELKPFNIQVKLIEPRAVDTQADHNTVISNCATTSEYQTYEDRIKGLVESFHTSRCTPPFEVAKTIMRAATENSSKTPVSGRQRQNRPWPWFHRMVSSM